MGRFDDLLTTSPQGTNPFADLTLPQGSRFDDLITPITPEKEGIFKRTLKSFGGAIGAVGRALVAPQQATTGLIEKGLEKVGVLEPKTKGLGIVEGVKEQKSNIELLKRIGQETGTGGLMTGQYTPTTSVFGNFIREVPVTLTGTLADIFVDPLFFASTAGLVKKGVTKTGEIISEGAKKAAKEIPAVQEVGEMLGKAFVTRFGQRPEFQALDISRKVEESFISEKVSKIVSPVIEKPAVIQQRITQILKGISKTDEVLPDELQPLAQEARKFKSAEEFVGAQPKLFHGTGADFKEFSAEKFGKGAGGDMFGQGVYLTDNPEIARGYANVSKTGVVKEVAIPQDAKLFDIDSRPTKELVSKVLKALERKFPEAIKSDVVKQDVAHHLKTNDSLGGILNVIDIDLKNNFPQYSKIFSEAGDEVFKAIKEAGFDGIRYKADRIAGSGLQGTNYVIFDTKKALTKSQLTDFYNQAVEKVSDISGVTDNELKILSEPIRQELDRIGESISKLNPKLLSEETFAANKGTYFPRLYTDYEFSEGEKVVEQIFGGRAVSIPKEPFKKRILTEAESLAKGTRIEEAGFPALKRLTQLNITEQRQKFFSEVSKLADDTPKPGWLQMSDDKALGELAGKFLPPAEYNAIAKIRHIPSATEQLYNKALMLWKTFKTAYNPATIARNDLTNYFILNPLGGVGPHRLDIYARTANEIYTKGPLYQLARKEGLEISTQQAAELTQQATRFYRENKSLVGQFFDKIGAFHELVKNFYGSQDKFFKLANFIKGVQEDGLSPFQALRRANFYLVDYSEVPQAIEWLRKSPVGIPFISFTYGVSKPLAKTLLERPDKLAAYFKILSGIQQMNPAGETQAERQAELDVAPDWIQTGTFLRLPFKDKFARGQFVDLQYILPFNILETRSILPSNPLLNSIASILTNKDVFTGKELVKETDTTLEKAEKYATGFLSQLLPSFTPFVGTSYKKLVAALQQRPDRNGFVKSKLEAFVDILGGIKITPIDPTIEAQKRAFEKQKEFQELHSQLKSIMLNKALFPEEKKREAEKIQEKIKEAAK